MFDATFVRPDLGAFCRLDELGLEVTGQRLAPDRAVLACRPVPGEFDRWCCRCGGEGTPRDSVTRVLSHEPFGHRPTSLLLTISRFGCEPCRHVWRQDTSKAAEPRAKLSRRALAWALHAIVVQHILQTDVGGHNESDIRLAGQVIVRVRAETALENTRTHHRRTS